jgi:hypothetical protein
MLGRLNAQDSDGRENPKALLMCLDYEKREK